MIYQDVVSIRWLSFRNVLMIEQNSILLWIIHLVNWKLSTVWFALISSVVVIVLLQSDAFKLRPRRALGSTKENDRYYSYGMNLNHNLLKDSLENFPKFIQTILVNPDTLSMIDLSFNQFTEIPSVRLTIFTGMSMMSLWSFRFSPRFPHWNISIFIRITLKLSQIFLNYVLYIIWNISLFTEILSRSLFPIFVRICYFFYPVYAVWISHRLVKLIWILLLLGEI